MYGASGGNGVLTANISATQTIWQFAGEGYWNGDFIVGYPTSSTVYFECGSANKAFFLMFW